MNIEKLQSLANTDFTNFIQSENNVKFKIVIPFLQAFNHKDLDLEHAAQGSRIDINIGNRIIVETKALGQNINMHVQQLSDYSGKELPVLAILTNGRHFRIYSPQWRHLRAFTEKIIYEFELKDLQNISLLTRLEKILDFSNYERPEFFVNIEEREREILQIRTQIETIKAVKKEKAKELQQEINVLKEQIQEINDQIYSKEQIIADINSEKIPEIEQQVIDSFLPIINTISESISNTKTKSRSTQAEVVSSNSNKLKMENPKKGVLAFGQVLSNGNLLVLKGSTISYKTSELFHINTPSAFKKRQQYLKDGTINSDRQFTMDKEFKSKSGAACIILGHSANGNKEWQSS